MEKELCEEKHKRVDERLDTHEKRLNAHADQIDVLIKSDASNTTMINQLCRKLDGLTGAIWGLVLLLGGALVGFFFYAIQNHLFS